MKQGLQRGAAFTIGAVVFLLFACTLSTFAQSLGDIARQERERKDNQTQHETHVYTNDDLAKQHILVPEDRERALTARSWIDPANQPAEASAEAPEIPGAIVVPPLPVKVNPIPTLVASAPAPVSTPHPAVPPARTPVAIPQPSTRVISRKVSVPALLASSRAPRVVRPATAKSVSTVSDAPVHKPVRSIEAQPEIEISDAGRVQVSRGDSLWKLAKQRLGSGARWRELAAVNPQLSNPDMIRAGQWIQLPSAGTQTAKHIVVRSGDTLWSVAQAQFGKGTAFSCIAGANPQLRSLDRIQPGETLVLPVSCSIAR